MYDYLSADYEDLQNLLYEENLSEANAELMSAFLAEKEKQHFLPF